jgi:thioredoxin-related protein
MSSSERRWVPARDHCPRGQALRAGTTALYQACFIALLALTAFAGSARAQEASPYAIDIPPWFVETFLDFREDIADAAKDGRRVMVYFGQDGCPYCRQLMVTNFSQRNIVDKTRRHFVAIALNIWGDREVTWLDGRTMSEKALARVLDVQFTPTLLFFDEKGNVVARLNGYYPPHKFEAVLDYVAGKNEKRETLAAYISRRTNRAASATLAAEPFFMKAPYVLTRKSGCKPLAVVFETPNCDACDEMHNEMFRRPDVLAQLARFDVARFGLGARADVTTPGGANVKSDAWARDLGVTYTPTIVFFDAGGREVFRLDAYMRGFHFVSAFDYVASGAYRSEPSFQRFLVARAERLRNGGERVDLWE